MDVSSCSQIVEHARVSLNCTPFCTRWLPFSPRFVLLGVLPRGAGLIRLYDLNRAQLSVTAEINTKVGIKCATFAASGSPGADTNAAASSNQLAVGDFDGCLSVWDVERFQNNGNARESTPLYSVKNAHDALINCIDGIGGLGIGNGAPEIATGGRDGCVRVWDIRQKQPVASLEPAKGSQVRDCWSVAFGGSYNDEERVVCAGYDNGDVKLMDLRMNKIRWQTNVKNGVVCVQFDRPDIPMNKLVVTTLESRFRVYDVRTYNPDLGYAYLSEKAHKSTVWLARHLPQNRDIFATCGGNGTLNLYKYSYPAKRCIRNESGQEQGVAGTLECVAKEKLADQPIVSLDWNRSKLGLGVMAALDQSLKVIICTKLQKL